MLQKAPSNGVKGSSTRVATTLQLAATLRSLETLFFLLGTYAAPLIYMRSCKCIKNASVNVKKKFV
jgi:hypothetical protein